MKNCILIISLLLLASCGQAPIEEVRERQAEEKAQRESNAEASEEKMVKIRALRQSVLKKMKYIDDFSMNFGDGMMSPGEGVIIELKEFHWGQYQGTIVPPKVCECPMHMEGDMAYPHQAVMNYRCIKFNARKRSNPEGNVNLDGEIDDIISPRYIPSGKSWISVYKLGTIKGKRYQIADMSEFSELMKLIEEARTEKINTERYSSYFEIQCFNEEFLDVPMDFIKSMN